MQTLPHFPLQDNVVSLFGLTLLLGLISGELIKRTYFLPKISGYIAIGFLVGPHMLNMVTPSLLSSSRIFVDISLGLILFQLGRHLDFTWLREDPGIIWMSMAEALLTFIFIFATLISFSFYWFNALLGATIAVTTAPAVVMMVADDLAAKGPVTRRTFILTSLNNLIGLILFTLLLASAQSESPFELISLASYRLLGSFFLGIIMFLITLFIAYLTGKYKENQFILFVGSVTFTIGISTILNLSSMLTLFTLGVAARNFNFKNLLTEVDFGWLAKLFFILLFVVTGVHLHINALFQFPGIVLAFLIVRALGKSCGIWLFSKKSRLTAQQSWAICFALTPMAGLALGMSNIISDLNSSLGYQLMSIITTAIAILNIFGPIATQLAFVRSDETTQRFHEDPL